MIAVPTFTAKTDALRAAAPGSSVSKTTSNPDRDSDLRLDTLILDHRPVLMAQAFRLTGGDYAWAEDVVQETFIRAWRRIDRMSAEYGSVRGWLTRVTHNLVMDGHRARRARPVEAEESEIQPQAINDETERIATMMLIEDVLSTLTAAHRTVLEQTYLKDRTMSEAARELDLPVGTVKSRLHHALRHLRVLMTQPVYADAA